MLVVGIVLGLNWNNPQVSIQTLRSDLAQIHLPSGYRLVKTQEAGTKHCAFLLCSLTQTWASAANDAPSPCTDVYQALSSAFSGVYAFSGVNIYSPDPPDDCDYTVTLSDTGGKRLIEATVQPQADHGFLIELTDSYP